MSLLLDKFDLRVSGLPGLSGASLAVALLAFAGPCWAEDDDPFAEPEDVAATASSNNGEANHGRERDREDEDEDEDESPKAAHAETARKNSEARPAKTGFQAAFRMGVMFPAGDATAKPGDTLGARYSWQVPFIADLGFKPTPHVFVGTYLGFSLGAEGSNPVIEAACDDNDENFENDVACSSATLRAGLEAQYHFAPDELWNPWIGYGFGVEAANETIDERGVRSESNMSTGLTFAQLSAGLDLRSAVGFGPYAEVTMGRFNSTRTEVNNVETFNGSIDDRAIHYWIQLGVRMVVRP